VSLAAVRSIADAVLYEGYLLYPYRKSAAKNRSRWQFGVLGPPRAAAAAFGEAPGMAMQCLLTAGAAASVRIHLRFLQVQVREVQRLDPDGCYRPVDELTVAGSTLLSWDEAIEHEIAIPALPIHMRADLPIEIPGGTDVEILTVPLPAPSPAVPLPAPGPMDGAENPGPWGDTVVQAVPAVPAVPGAHAAPAVPATHAAPTAPVAPAALVSPVGRIVRRRWPLAARLRTRTDGDGRYLRLTVEVSNEHPAVAGDKDAAIRSSLIGTHLLLEAYGCEFVSLLEPPPAAVAAAQRCRQSRCWPVLAGVPGSRDVVLGAPIILYDHPQVAEQSPGALFDSCEIDEILTLRVMTMTEAEKAEARSTDPRAAAIVDRCDAMTAADLQRLHGVRRDPDVPWWDPEVDARARPESDAVLINGVRVAKGSLVRVHPTRRADAQDLFFAGQVARVTAVLDDVDGGVHVALVLVDDPAADLHDWYGRYFYFAPDELEPLEENRS